MFDPPLPPPPPTYRKWRIDRIVLKDEKSWQQLLNDMSTAEVEGWDVENLEFHNILEPHSKEQHLMSILVLSRDEVRRKS